MIIRWCEHGRLAFLELLVYALMDGRMGPV